MASTTSAAAGTSTMSNSRSSVSSREMSRFRSNCTAAACCASATMSWRRSSIAARCSGGDHGGWRRLLAAAGAQLGELLLRLVQMRLQRLLGLAELRLGLVAACRRPARTDACCCRGAQPDQRVAAGQRADQVGDERPVVAERRRLLLAEEVAARAPRTGRPGCRCRRRRRGWPARRSAPCRPGNSPGRFWPCGSVGRPGERRFQHAVHPRGDDAAGRPPA